MRYFIIIFFLLFVGCLEGERTFVDSSENVDSVGESENSDEGSEGSESVCANSPTLDWGISTFLPTVNQLGRNNYTITTIQDCERYGFQVFLKHSVSEILIETDIGYIDSLAIKQFAQNALSFEIYILEGDEFKLLSESNYGELNQFESNPNIYKIKFPATYNFGESFIVFMQMSFNGVNELGGDVLQITPNP